MIRSYNKGERNPSWKGGYSRNDSEFHSTYHAYHDMKQRCYNPKVRNYKNYGGRGIEVCDRWLGENGFINLLEDMGKCPEGLTLERKDTNGHYYPENCKWATREEQYNNLRKSVFVEHEGIRLTMAQVSRKMGISYGCIKWRKSHGWTDEQIMTLPACQVKGSRK